MIRQPQRPKSAGPGLDVPPPAAPLTRGCPPAQGLCAGAAWGRKRRPGRNLWVVGGGGGCGGGERI